MSRVESMVRTALGAAPGGLLPRLRAVLEQREHLLLLGPDRVRHAERLGGEECGGGEGRLPAAEALAAGILQAAVASWPKEAHVPALVREGAAVLVSDRWLQWMVVPWSDQLLRREQAESQYRLHFSAAFGAEAQGFAYAADDADAGEPRVVAAIERELLLALGALADERGAQLVSVQPLSYVVWGAAHATLGTDNYAFAVIDQGVMTFLLVRGGRPQQVAVQRWTGSWPVALEQLRRRTALREPDAVGIDRVLTVDISGSSTGEAVPASIVRLPGPKAPGGLDWLSLLKSRKVAGGPEFVRGAAPARGWRLGALASGVLLAAASTLWYQGASQQLGMVQDEVAQLTGANRSPAPPVPRGREAEMRAVDKAVLQLNVPVDTLLGAVQAPADMRVALLGLDVSGEGPQSNTVRVSAEARTSAEMAAYVSHVGSTPPFIAAVLTRHEVAKGPGRPYRFTVEATWRD